MKTIAVIVPVKNDLRGIKLLLSCLRKQTLPYELVFVDNGSTDGTLEYLDSQGVRVLRHPGIRVGALRNRGVEATQSDFLAFADSDHEVGPDWLDQGARVLESEPGIVACGSHYLPPDQGTWVQRVWGIHRLRGAQVGDVDWLASGNLFVSREAFVKVQGFRENLLAAEDVDLCHRLKEAGGRVRHDPAIASVHHGEAATLRRFIKKEWWRGSSGIRAWIAQGFPIREIPSLVWPLWHLVFSLFFLLALCLALWIVPAGFSIWLLVGVSVLWVAPALGLALAVGRKRGVKDVFLLAILYFVYGMTRGWALFRN